MLSDSDRKSLELLEQFLRSEHPLFPDHFHMGSFTCWLRTLKDRFSISACGSTACALGFLPMADPERFQWSLSGALIKNGRKTDWVDALDSIAVRDWEDLFESVNYPPPRPITPLRVAYRIKTYLQTV